MTFDCITRHANAYPTSIKNKSGESMDKIVCPDCGYMASPDKFRRLKV